MYPKEANDLRLVFSKNIARRIREFRIEKGYNQPQFAYKIGADIKTLQKWEGGTRVNLYSAVFMIATAFGCEPHIFFCVVPKFQKNRLERFKILKK